MKYIKRFEGIEWYSNGKFEEENEIDDDQFPEGKLNDAIFGDDDRNFFINYYECDNCGETWEDEWDATCDDDCSNCGATISPYFSEDAN